MIINYKLSDTGIILSTLEFQLYLFSIKQKKVFQKNLLILKLSMNYTTEKGSIILNTATQYNYLNKRKIVMFFIFLMIF